MWNPSQAIVLNSFNEQTYFSTIIGPQKSNSYGYTDSIDLYLSFVEIHKMFPEYRYLII